MTDRQTDSKCLKCLGFGHMAKDCTSTTDISILFRRREGRYYLAKDCPMNLHCPLGRVIKHPDCNQMSSLQDHFKHLIQISHLAKLLNIVSRRVAYKESYLYSCYTAPSMTIPQYCNMLDRLGRNAEKHNLKIITEVAMSGNK